MSEITLTTRLWRADTTRKTRFHTSNDQLCLHPFDLARVFFQTGLRHATGTLPAMPWLTYPAIRFLRTTANKSASVFEFGSGMSTHWFAERCRTVCSVEHNFDWYEKIARGTKSNARLLFEPEREGYVSSIDKADGPFDIVLVDGKYRTDCVRAALPHIKRPGYLVVDNTDGAGWGTSRLLADIFSPDAIQTFPGYAPASLHANETTICTVR